MSRKPSKFRKAKREQRERAKLIAGHYHVGDTHIGHKALALGRLGNHDQLMAYAGAAGLGEVVIITGGDLVHPMPADIVEFDLTRTRETLDEFTMEIARAIKGERK